MSKTSLRKAPYTVFFSRAKGSYWMMSILPRGELKRSDPLSFFGRGKLSIGFLPKKVAESKRKMRKSDKHLIKIEIRKRFVWWTKWLFFLPRPLAAMFVFPAWNQYYPDYRPGCDAVFDLTTIQLKELAKQIKGAGIPMMPMSKIEKGVHKEVKDAGH